MTVQQLLILVATTASNHGEQVANADVVVDGDRNEYKLIDVEYNAQENKFHLKVEEEG